jgi:GT2 family glycosyltransferase
MQPRLVSIIIPHYNGISVLNECLVSIKRSIYPYFEVVVVDNGSMDGSVRFLQEQHPDVHIVTCAENLGFAGGCNEGILHARGELVLILNNDTTHEPDWIAHLVRALQSDPDVALVQPKILSFQNREYFDYSGASGGYLDLFGYPFTRGRIFDTIETDKGQYNDRREIFWASGTAFLARKDIIQQAGLFDIKFFAHMEEIDLDWRVHLMGYKIIVEPAAVVYHHSGYTLNAETFTKKYLNHRNSLIMITANYQWATLFWILPVRLFMEVCSFFASIIKRDFLRVAAIFSALLWLCAHPVYLWKKHNCVKKIRRRDDNQLMQRMHAKPVAVLYFLQGKRFFDQLLTSGTL